MQGILSPMLRRISSFILLILVCGSFDFAFAQQSPPPPESNNEKTARAASPPPPAAQPAAMPESAPELKPIVPAAKSAAVLFNLTRRVGVDPSQTAPLSLNDAIRRALVNNNDVEIARDDVRFNETTLRSLEGAYDTFFTVTPTFTRNSNARSGGGATNDFSANFGLSQNIPVGGGQITPFFNNSRTGTLFNNSVTSGGTTNNQTNFSSGTFFSSALGINYTQPLLRNRSIDQTRRGIRVQRRRLEQSDADFRQRTIETIASVQRAYWDLVFALRDQQNKTDNLGLTRENMRRVEAQISAGSAAQLARAEVATELANREGEVLSAVERVTRAENTFKQLILKDPNSPEWTTPIIPTDTPTFDAPAVKLEDALADAKTNRPELKRLNLQNEINKIDVEYFRNQVKPQIDLVSSFSLDGFAQSALGTVSTTNVPLFVAQNTQINGNAFLFDQINLLRTRSGLNPLTQGDIPNVAVSTNTGSNIGGLGSAFGNLFNSNSPTFSVGVSIALPLRNKTAKADLAGALIQRSQIEAQTRAREQIVITEVRNAVQGVETARQRIDSARVARENADVQLQGEQKLYDVGRSTTFLLFQRENTLANAKTAEVQAQTDYNKALAELQRATSTTLRANNVFVEGTIIQ